jgi:hypothetical protein
MARFSPSGRELVLIQWIAPVPVIFGNFITSKIREQRESLFSARCIPLCEPET